MLDALDNLSNIRRQKELSSLAHIISIQIRGEIVLLKYEAQFATNRVSLSSGSDSRDNENRLHESIEDETGLINARAYFFADTKLQSGIANLIPKKMEGE